jgi:hypothetical protein
MAYMSSYGFDILAKLEIPAATGANTKFGHPFNWAVFTNGSTQAAQTLTMSTPTVDGKILMVSTFSTITALTFSPAVTGWTNGSTLTAGTGLMIGYSLPLAVFFVAIY